MTVIVNEGMVPMTDYLKTIPLFDILKTEDLLKADQYFKVEELNGEEIILNAGRRCRRLYFIVSGLVFSYASDENEKILWYEFEGNAFTDINSFYTQTPSENYIRAGKGGTTLLSISYENLTELYRNSHKWAIWGTRFKQNELVRLTSYYEGLRVKDASQRYFELTEAYPEILRQIPLGHIASYLGISQVSLSRIRAGIQKK